MIFLKRNKFIILSVLAHLILLGVFSFRHSFSPPMRKGEGIVTVNFIETIDHDEDTGDKDPEPQKNKKDPSKFKAKPLSETNLAQQAAQEKLPGDPRALARESDLFIAAVMKLVDLNKVYPQEAIDREEEGKVLVAVTISREGQLVELKVEDPSPFELLNEAALTSVQKIKKFPEVPLILSAPIHLHIPLMFKVKRL